MPRPYFAPSRLCEKTSISLFAHLTVIEAKFISVAGDLDTITVGIEKTDRTVACHN
jgi:hypothetical protein